MAINLSEERLNLVREVGADSVYNSNDFTTLEILTNTDVKEGFDITFEVAVVESTFIQSVDLTKPRGQVVILSIFSDEIRWNPVHLTRVRNTDSRIMYKIP